jgi:hypothetical protein
VEEKFFLHPELLRQKKEAKTKFEEQPPDELQRRHVALNFILMSVHFFFKLNSVTLKFCFIIMTQFKQKKKKIIAKVISVTAMRPSLLVVTSRTNIS